MFRLLTSDLTVWKELGDRHAGHLFVGLFLAHGNEGLSISPTSLAAIAERGLALDLDIYSI